MQVDYMERLALDDREIESRRQFFEITDEDLARLARLRPFAEKKSQVVIDDLYELILAHPDSRSFFAGDPVVHRVKTLQKKYFLGLFAGRCDRAYVEDRLLVGAAHERVGVQPKWYIGAYGRYMRSLFDHVAEELPDAKEARAAMHALIKLISFDMALAMDTYIAASLDTVARHQAAIRELSTPVIRVHDRILLLPLVGTIDTVRAHQIMEALLTNVVERQAKIVIVDIAGVPVVDTKVADHLLKTTAAVRLLGADTILTGISAQVARTMVQLGVDLAAMQTSTRLADGIELALGKLGLSIGPTGGAPA